MYKQLIKNLSSKNFKYIAIITTIFMLIAHGFAYTNVFFSHDSMKVLYWGESLSYDTVEIGRYIIPLLLILRGKYYPPFLIGILSIIFMIFIICFLVDLFNIKNKKHIAILSGILSTSCTITLLNATYIEYSDMYILSYLLSIISAYFLLKSKNKYRVPLSIIMFIISMGIYQTALPIFVVTIIISTIIDVLEGKNINKIFKKFCLYIGIGALASILYYIIFKLILIVFNITPSLEYNSINNLAKYNSLTHVFTVILKQYFATMCLIVKPSTYYKLPVFLINIYLIIITIFMLTYINIKKNSSILRYLFLVFLLISLTFSINCTFFFSNEILHQLMIFPMFLLYLFLIVLEENFIKHKYLSFKSMNAINKFITLSLALIIISSIIYSNHIYLKKQMEFETTKLTMNRIIQNIENIDEYKIGTTPVVFIGYLSNGPLSMKKPELDYDSVGLWNTYSITYYLNYKQFLNNYMGYPINVLNEKKAIKYSKKNEVKEMESFPSKKAYKIVDDVLVIKLSESTTKY